MVLLFVQVVIGGTFALSVVLKLLSFDDFADGLSGYGVKPGMSRAVAWAVIAAEAAITAAMLLGPPLPFVGLCGAAALVGAFLAVLVRQIVQGHAAPCYCFGRSRRSASWPELVRNAGLIVVASIGAALLVAQGALTSPWLGAGIENPPAARWVVVGLGGLFALTWSQLPEITAMLQIGRIESRPIVVDQR